LQSDARAKVTIESDQACVEIESTGDLKISSDAAISIK
jgi:hypothetical protein